MKRKQENLKEAHEKGYNLGREDGIECDKESTTMKTAKSLLKYGMSVVDIVKNTEYSQKRLKNYLIIFKALEKNLMFFIYFKIITLPLFINIMYFLHFFT